jgi:hypothetical protein
MSILGHDYDSPSSLNPGLLMFLVDKSLYSQQSELMPILSKQIYSICKRFEDANKKGLFRLVICEFANAPQRRNDSLERGKKGKKKQLLNEKLYEIQTPTYKFEGFVEDFSEYHANRLFLDGTRVGGTNLKAVIDQALNEVSYHQEKMVFSDTQKPPISILMFSGNKHDANQDYTGLPGKMGAKRGEFHNIRVDDMATKLAEIPNVLFGVFKMHGKRDDGESISKASIFSEKMIQQALKAEDRYKISANQRLDKIFPNPIDLVGKPFIFEQALIAGSPKLISALIRLGTSTVLEGLDDDESSDESDPGTDW